MGGKTGNGKTGNEGTRERGNKGTERPGPGEHGTGVACPEFVVYVGGSNPRLNYLPLRLGGIRLAIRCLPRDYFRMGG